jgi:hypothetical protein
VAVAVDWTTISPNVKSNGKNKSKKKAGMSGSWSDDDYYLLEFRQEKHVRAESRNPSNK